MDDLEEALYADEKSLTYQWDHQIHRIISAPFTSYDDTCYKHILWVDKEHIQKLDVKKLFIDGTFKTRPKLHISRTKSQFLTLMTEIAEGEVCIFFVCVGFFNVSLRFIWFLIVNTTFIYSNIYFTIIGV